MLNALFQKIFEKMFYSLNHFTNYRQSFITVSTASVYKYKRAIKKRI